MPYKLSDDGKAILVYKDGGWQVKYRHASKKEALAQLYQLVKNVKGKGHGERR